MTFHPDLTRTLEHATTFPLYQELWGRNVISQIQGNNLTYEDSREILSTLPYIGKPELQRLTPKLGASIGSVRYTSGTTGVPTPRYRSPSELNREDITPSTYSLHAEAVLRLTDSYHMGQSVFERYIKPVIPLSVTDPHSLSKAIHILTYGLPGYGQHTTVSTIVSSVTNFIILTAALEETDLLHSAPPKMEILLYGKYPNIEERHYLSEMWGDQIIYSYSASEVAFASHSSTNYYPIGIYNTTIPLLRFDTEPTMGRLAFTECLPLGEIQPLVNYDPGDIFEFNAGDSTVYPLGRVSRSAFQRNGSLLLGNYQLEDALTALPPPTLVPYRFIPDHARISFPRNWSANLDKSVLSIILHDPCSVAQLAEFKYRLEKALVTNMAADYTILVEAETG